MTSISSYQRRMSGGGQGNGSLGMLGPSSGSAYSGSSSASSTSPTLKASSASLFGSVYLRIVDDSSNGSTYQYLIPLVEVSSYPNLFSMVQKLNTNKRIYEGEAAFSVHVDEDGKPGAIILERFWDKVVRDGLRVIVVYKRAALPIDRSLSSGLGSLKDQDDSFYPHYS